MGLGLEHRSEAIGVEAELLPARRSMAKLAAETGAGLRAGVRAG